MEVRTNHLPMCTCPIWYLSLGYDPAHQHIRPPWAHTSQGSYQCQSHPIIDFIKHVHKTPFTLSSAQRHYTNLQAKFGRSDKASYWASVHWMWDVFRRNQIQVMLVGEVVKGCLDKGCSDSREMHGLPVCASVEGELHLSWMQMFPSPFMPFILYSLLLFLSRR
jgi:hypothetical protein